MTTTQPVARDTGERKEPEEGTKRLHAVIAAAAEGIILVDDKGVFTICNPAAERILGVLATQIVGSSALDAQWQAMMEDGAPWPNETFPVMVTHRTGQAFSDAVMGVHRPDGALAWISINTRPLERGADGYAQVVSFFDITDRKRGEATARVGEERLRLALQAARVTTWDWNIETDELLWSENATFVLGVATGARATGHSVLAVTHPEDRRRVRRSERRAIAGNDDYTCEYRLRTPDGHTRWLASRGRVVERGPDGRAIRIVGATADVTESRRTETLRALQAAIGKAWSEGTRLGDVLQRCAEGIAEQLDAAFVRIWTLDEAPRTLELQASAGLYTHLDGAHARIPVGQFKIGRIAADRLPHLTNDVLTDPAISDPAWARRQRVVAFAGYPLLVEGRLVGVIGLFARHPLAEEVLEALATVADTIAQGIDRKRAEEALRAREARFRSLIQHASDIIVVLDAEGKRQYHSPSMERVLGWRPEELVGTDAADLRHPDDAAAAQRFLTELRNLPGGQAMTEWRVQRRDGSWGWFEIVATNLLADPELAGIVINAREITERKQFTEQLTHQALHDPLTNLANRALFHDRLARALARGGTSDVQVAVLFLDLDRFKHVNDSFGHEAGDQLLVAVSERLSVALRASDSLARFGGDEFMVMVVGVTEPHEAVQVANRLVEALRTPVCFGGRETVVTVSVGLAIGTPGLAEPGEVLRQADVALYEAKARGGDDVAVFDPVMAADVFGRLELEQELRHALERRELVLHYQPIVRLNTGEVAALEALVRWQHPTRGLLTPDTFVPLAETTGLIVPIGAWVLMEACRQMRAWQLANPQLTAQAINVNLSARQLCDPALVATVTRILGETGLAPDALRLEITEQVLTEELRAAADTLRALRELGVRLAIDDFGVGHSSLSYLRQLDADVLKIDRSFVRDLARDEGSADIVRAVAWLAHRFGMQVTAEGVETAEQLASARAVGCDRAQGHLFAKPVPAGEAGELLARRWPEATLLPSAPRESTQPTASPLRPAHSSGESGPR